VFFSDRGTWGHFTTWQNALNAYCLRRPHSHPRVTLKAVTLTAPSVKNERPCNNSDYLRRLASCSSQHCQTSLARRAPSTRPTACESSSATVSRIEGLNCLWDYLVGGGFGCYTISSRRLWFRMREIRAMLCFCDMKRDKPDA
jgi:hypothetical protein